MIRIKDILLLSFAVLWILFFLSPLATYGRNTRATMTRTERLVMIVLGLMLLMLLWLSLPRH